MFICESEYSLLLMTALIDDKGPWLHREDKKETMSHFISPLLPHLLSLSPCFPVTNIARSSQSVHATWTPHMSSASAALPLGIATIQAKDLNDGYSSLITNNESAVCAENISSFDLINKSRTVTDLVFWKCRIYDYKFVFLHLNQNVCRHFQSQQFWDTERRNSLIII